MLSGSTAISFYAQPRSTRDIDIVIEIDKRGAKTLSKLFQSDFYIDEDTVVDAIDGNGFFNILHNETLLKVDLIIKKETEYRKLEFSRRKVLALGTTQLSVVSAEDLILSKLVWATSSQSAMQLDDVRNLVQSNYPLDWQYLMKWADALGVLQELNASKK